MDKLKALQIKKLLKELDFIESDFEYRNEVISEADSEFINSINSFLKNHPDLKEIYDNKVTEKINESIKKTEENIEKDHQLVEEYDIEDQTEKPEDIDEVEETIEDKKDLSQLKRLYREIVKLTHPDKVKNPKMNELYIKATKYYEDENRIGLYAICNELNIDYDLQDSDVTALYQQIKRYQDKISFIESTYTWKWYNTQNEEEKNQIMLNYIKLRISS